MKSAGDYAFEQVESALSILDDGDAPLRDRLGDAWASRLSRLTSITFPNDEMCRQFAVVAAQCGVTAGSHAEPIADVVDELLALRDGLAGSLGLPVRQHRRELAA